MADSGVERAAGWRLRCWRLNSTVTATALINLGALVAFTFVNLSVISQFWIREKRNKTLKDHFNYLVLPVCGALTVGALWINLEESSGDSA